MTPKRRIVVRYILGIFSVSCLSYASAFAQFEARSAEEFTRATLMQKRQALGQIATHSGLSTSAEAQEVLRAGLSDPEPQVREAALFAMAGRMRAAGHSTQLVDVWRSEVPSLRGLKPTAVKLLSDGDPKVRIAAMNALCAMDFDPTKSVVEANTLSPSTVAALIRAYSADDTPVVRAHAISLLGLTATDKSSDRAVDAALISALSDSESAVVQSAATGVGRRRASLALPSLVRLLADGRPEVRMRSAQAIAHFEAEAKPFLEALEEALARETNETTRRVLDTTIQRLLK